ncbi:MAG: flavin reductase family protein [Crocinitomicaceae bacterium]|jgi:flavin reductase (DIM6/NTAB) family NADH-FMN oxidoreductase RutF
MICIDKLDFKKLDKVPRLNLINSCMGFKSANLIGTISKEGVYNLAIFSSITHLGSDPALLGFILRPTTVPRHTYSNIRETDYFSVNAITESLVESAHKTSANYSSEVNEFEVTGIEMELKDNFQVPFVKSSPVQLLCKYLNEYIIEENGTIHVIASIEKIFVKDELLLSDHWIQLDKGNVVAINGLDGYSKTELVSRFSYARVGKTPEKLG